MPNINTAHLIHIPQLKKKFEKKDEKSESINIKAIKSTMHITNVMTVEGNGSHCPSFNVSPSMETGSSMNTVLTIHSVKTMKNAYFPAVANGFFIAPSSNTEAASFADPDDC
jgi:hypothetical protein